MTETDRQRGRQRKINRQTDREGERVTETDRQRGRERE